MFSLIKATWKAVQWLRKQRAEMENDVDAYLSDKKAREWRLNIEKLFVALEKGNGASILPPSLQSVAKWMFDRTTVENKIGAFGQVILKSEKIHKKDPSLNEDIAKIATE